MTNDKACQILVETWGGCVDAQGLIFALERLGVLKLDSPRKKAEAVLDGCGYDGSDVIELLTKHGLKIVEKST